MDNTSNAIDVRVAIIGDRHNGFVPQDAIEPALSHSAEVLGLTVNATWLATPSLLTKAEEALRDFDAIWCAPGSPFVSLEGAVNGIRVARETNTPFLGTCAGFQHGVIEVARNLVGVRNANHAEYEPEDESELFIDELLCSLAGKTMSVSIVDAVVSELYGAKQIEESYYCRFGLNEKFLPRLEQEGLVVAGIDASDNGTRLLRLRQHSYFLLTLFVPQTRSTPNAPHPLITGFVNVAQVVRRELETTDGP